MFANLNEVDWKNAMPVVCTVGIIMFNMTFMLFFILGRLTNKDIGAGVPENWEYRDNWLFMFARRYPYIVVVNLALLVLFIIAA